MYHIQSLRFVLVFLWGGWTILNTNKVRPTCLISEVIHLVWDYLEELRSS